MASSNLAVLIARRRTGRSRSMPFLNGVHSTGMTNYMGNYGGPGPISLMSGTIIPGQ